MTEYQKIENELRRLGWTAQQGKGDHIKFRKEGVTKILRHIGGIGPAGFHLPEEGLEPRRAMLLPLTVVGIVISEQPLEPLRLRKVPIDLALLGTTVEFAALTA